MRFSSDPTSSNEPSDADTPSVEGLAPHKQQASAQTAQLSEALAQSEQILEQLRLQASSIEPRLNQSAARGDYQGLASVTQQAQLQQIKTMQTAVRTLRPQDNKNSERLRRVKGLLLWDMAASFPAQREDAFNQLQQHNEAIELLEIKRQSLMRTQEQLNNRFGDDTATRLASFKKRTQNLRDQMQERLSEHRVALEKLALIVLAQNRRNLTIQLAQAHIAIARLQDTEGVINNEQGAQ